MNSKYHLIKGQTLLSICFIFLCTCLSTVCTSTAHGTVPVKAQSTPKELIAVIPPDFPPTYYRDETTGQAVGFSVDVMNEVARRTGFSVKYTYAASWDLMEQDVLSGKADLIPALTINEKRLKSLIFTAPVETLKISLVARASDTSHQHIEPGMKIGVMQGSSVTHFLLKRDDITQVPYAGLQQLLFDLLAGRVDLAMTAASNILKLAREINIEDRIRIIEPCQYEAKRGMALRPTDEDLRDQLNLTINQFVNTLEYQVIYHKWWGKPGLSWNSRRVAWIIFTVISLLTSGFMAFRFFERRHANKELRKSEQKYRMFIETAGEGVIATDKEFKITFVNRRITEMLGYAQNELLGKSVELLIFNKDRTEQKEKMLLIQQESTCVYERRFRHKNGSAVWTLASASAILDDQGIFAGSYAMFTDITERKQADLALAERRKELEVLHKISEIALGKGPLQSMLQEIVQEVSSALCFPTVAIEYFHEDKQEMECAAVSRVVMPTEASTLRIPASETLSGQVAQNGQPIIKTFPLEQPAYGYKMLRPLEVQTFVCIPMLVGSKITGTLSMSSSEIVFLDECFLSLAGSLANFIASIIEHERTLEEKTILLDQLHQAQKMDAIGRLAGGVAHDFNNMLNVIMGYSELGLDTIEPSDPLYQTLTVIKNASERSANVVRQLLAFARKQTISPQVLDLNHTIENMLKMLRRLIGEHIDLVWKPTNMACTVKMDPSQVDQILANLVVNARDAIWDIGKVTIETETITFDADYCRTHSDFKPGDYVMLVVKDDGCGMDRTTVANLFEPFFTTKEQGKGTGLGLATVYGLVKQNNGFIEVDSEPGKGSTFKIYIPGFLSGESPDWVVAQSNDALAGKETVLLVEDEASILELTTLMLEGMGYTVLAANTPEEALEIAEKHLGEIHLLATDVIMPGMNGQELSKHILALYPELKILFLSGYTANVIAHHGVLDKGVNFIQKPFTKIELFTEVRNALDR